MEAKDLQALSEVVGRAMLSARLGKQYGTDRDLYEALGYKNILYYDDYCTQYSRQDIAKAIIERPANATWKGKLQLIESNESEETEFEKVWEKLELRLSLKNVFIRLDKLTCLGGYGVLLLGLDDVKQQMDWAKPVKEGRRELLYLRPLGENNAQVDTWEKNAGNSRYGLPNTYTIMLTEPGSTGASFSLKVHYTRVLHVVYSKLESETIGSPVLKSVFNRLMDLEKLVGGSAEMFWRGARPGYAANVDKDFEMTQATEDGLQDQFDEFEHKLRRFLLTEGVDIKTLDNQISDPTGHVSVQLQMISADTGIPMRILIGSERGELASTQDEDAWMNLITIRREDFAEPMIVRPFVEFCVKYKILPEPTESWNISWGDLFAKSEKDMAEVGRIRATALREYTLNPGAMEVIPLPAFCEFFLGFTQEQINLITEMQKNDVTTEEVIQRIIDRETAMNPPKPPTIPKPVGV